MRGNLCNINRFSEVNCDPFQCSAMRHDSCVRNERMQKEWKLHASNSQPIKVAYRDIACNYLIADGKQVCCCRSSAHSRVMTVLLEPSGRPIRLFSGSSDCYRSPKSTDILAITDYRPMSGQYRPIVRYGRKSVDQYPCQVRPIDVKCTSISSETNMEFETYQNCGKN